jgi:hypothetical protein
VFQARNYLSWVTFCRLYAPCTLIPFEPHPKGNVPKLPILMEVLKHWMETDKSGHCWPGNRESVDVCAPFQTPSWNKGPFSTPFIFSSFPYHPSKARIRHHQGAGMMKLQSKCWQRLALSCQKWRNGPSNRGSSPFLNDSVPLSTLLWTSWADMGRISEHKNTGLLLGRKQVFRPTQKFSRLWPEGPSFFH